MVGIYKITSPSGRVNIGQSWDIDRRWDEYKKRSCIQQPLVYRSFSKYGVDKHRFEVLQELPSDITQKALDNLEIFFIKCYKECGFSMMNLQEGGRGGKHAKESKLKMSMNGKGGGKSVKRGPMSEEMKKNISNALRKSIEKRKTLGIYKNIHIGRRKTDEERRKISEGRKGKYKGDRPKEVKDKISKSLTGRKLTEEHRKNLSISHKRINNLL